MAVAPHSPSTMMGGFDMPPSAAIAIQNRKEVTWNPTMKEKQGKTTEIRVFPVKLQVTLHLSILTVMKKAGSYKNYRQYNFCHFSFVTNFIYLFLFFPFRL
jgi:hypothetical protein